MPLPVDFNTGTVTGKFVDLLGAPVVGKLTFTVSPKRLIDPAYDTIIVPAPKVVTLDGTGAMTIDLPATDDPDILPTGFTYQVVEQFSVPGQAQTYSIPVPKGTTTDLSTIIAVSPSDGATILIGPPGRSLLTGFGPPSLALGALGDTYIDKTASTIYGPKSSSGWGTPTLLGGGGGGPFDPAAVGAMVTGNAEFGGALDFDDVTGKIDFTLAQIGANHVDPLQIPTINPVDGTILGADGTGLPGTLSTHEYVDDADAAMWTAESERYNPNSVLVAVADNDPQPLTFTPETVLGMGATGTVGLIDWADIGTPGGGGGLTPETNGDWILGLGTLTYDPVAHTNTMDGGVVRLATAILVTSAQTVTGTNIVNDWPVGTSVLARMDQTLDNDNSVGFFDLGPIGYSQTYTMPQFAGSRTAGFKFPSAQIEVEGTIQYAQPSSGYGGAGVGFQAFKLIKNSTGVDADISGYQPFLSVPFYMADGEAIVFAGTTGESSVDGVVGIHQGFCDYPCYGTSMAPGGQLGGIVGVSYVSQSTYGAGAIGEMRWGFQYFDAQTNLNPLLDGGGDPDFAAGNILNFDTFGSLIKQTAVHVPFLKGAIGNVGIHNGSTTVYSPQTTTTVTASSQLAPNATLRYIQATAGNVILTANPPILGGIEDGQVIRFMNVGLTGNTITFVDGNTLSIPPGTGGHVTVAPGETVEFTWWDAFNLWFTGSPVPRSATSIANPSGGSVIDVQCRAQLDLLLNRVRTIATVAP